MSSQPQLKKARNSLFSYYRKESKDQSTSETNLSSNINVPIPDKPPSSKPQIVSIVFFLFFFLCIEYALRGKVHYVLP